MLNPFASVILAAEAEPSGTDLLLPVMDELIAGVIAFTLVFLVAWKFAAPAIKQTLENRQQAITGQIQEAETIKTEAAGLLEDYKAQLADARNEAGRIIDEARQSAEAVKADILAKATTEAAAIVEKAHTEAQAEKVRALQEARTDMAALSLDLAEKVVGNSLDRDAQTALVDSYLSDLDRMAN